MKSALACIEASTPRSGTVIYNVRFELHIPPPSFYCLGIRNFWLIKCQRCKEENLSQRII
ncbi:hypothetical protein APA44_33555 [Pseudomonas aeruginosa]|nr:hypothetical protein APA44_33555 [Pseudomonas aeruginosa]